MRGLLIVVVVLGLGLVSWQEQDPEPTGDRTLFEYELGSLTRPMGPRDSADGLPALGFRVSDTVSGAATVVRQAGDTVAVCVAVNVPQGALNEPVKTLRVLWHLKDGTRLERPASGGGGPLVLFASPDKNEVPIDTIAKVSVHVSGFADWAR